MKWREISVTKGYKPLYSVTLFCYDKNMNKKQQVRIEVALILMAQALDKLQKPEDVGLAEYLMESLGYNAEILSELLEGL